MAVMVRLLSENRITKEQFEKLKTVNIRLEASRRGLDTALYEKSPEKDQYASFGEYARLLEKKKSVLTDSLYTQFLQEGFFVKIPFLGMKGGAWLND